MFILITYREGKGSSPTLFYTYTSKCPRYHHSQYPLMKIDDHKEWSPVILSVQEFGICDRTPNSDPPIG